MKYQNFREFYPFYLSQHQNPTCRIWHAVGTACASIFLLLAILTMDVGCFVFALIIGYSFAWIGHWHFEKNQPATFQHPFYSFIADFVMLKDMLTGKLK